MCLQSMVDEIIVKKSGKDFEDRKMRTEKLAFMTRQKRVVNMNKQDDENLLFVPKNPELNQGENTIFDDDNFISNDDL